MRSIDDPKTDPAFFELVASRFRALSEPSRLKLLSLLQDGERTVGDLAEASGLGFANTSKHLSILHAQGFLSRRKVDVRTLYAIADEWVFNLCDIMCRRVTQGVPAVRPAAPPR